MENSALKIAVTGGAGSGKSTVCELFKKLGLTVYDADWFAREAVQENTSAYRKIVDFFGKKVLNRDGSFNRMAIRKIIIGDSQSRKTLEGIVHPEVIRMMMEKLEEAVSLGRNVVIEVPLLFELNLEKFFDFSVMVFSDKETKAGRLQKRDGVEKELAIALVDLQMPDSEKLERADLVVCNRGSLEDLEENVKNVYDKIFYSSENNKIA